MKLYSIEESTDSYIFMKKEPNRYVMVFFVMIILIIISAIIGMNYLNKPYIVKAEGSVRLNQSTYLASSTYGTIATLNKTEGDRVEKEEVILSLSDGKENLQEKYLNDQIKILEEQKINLKKYVEGLNTRTLTLTENEDLAYYGKLKYYLDTVEEEVKHKSSLLSKIEFFEMKIKEEINADILEGYHEQIEQLEQQRDSQPPSNNIYYQLTSDAGIEKNKIEQEIIEIRKQIDIVATQNRLYEIRAQDTGKIHYLVPLEIGMPLDPNQVFGEIQKESGMEIESYIPSHDRHKVTVGDDVRIIVHGSNVIQNGSIEGKIENIDDGITASSDGKSSYYLAKVSQTTNKTKNLELFHGIPVEVQIVYNEETYLEWLLNLMKFI